MRRAKKKKKEAAHHSLSLTSLLSQKSNVASLCIPWSKESPTVPQLMSFPLGHHSLELAGKLKRVLKEREL